MSTPRRQHRSRSSRAPLLIVVLVAVVAAGVAAAIHFTTARPPEAAGGGTAPLEPGGKARGREGAPVTITVYSDFLCIHCANFGLDTSRVLIAEFVEPGIARLVYRQFPVIAQLSVQIAEASECAADQRRFWAFHDAVYARLQRRAMRGGPDIDAAAREARLDLAALAACQRGGAMRARVEADYTEGARRGVEATPTIFVNDRMIRGNQPVDVFRSAINAARPR